MKAVPDGPNSDDPVRLGSRSAGQKTGDEEYDSLRDYWDGLSYKGQWEAFFEAVRQRDLAIAHDRQPYPTAEAYETLAAVHAKCQKSIDVLRLALAEAYADLPDDTSAADVDFGEGAPNVDDERSLHGDGCSHCHDLERAKAFAELDERKVEYYDPNIGGYRVTPPVYGRPRSRRNALDGA